MADEDTERRILCQLKSENGELLGAPIDLSVDINKEGLEKLCNQLSGNVRLNLKDD